MFPACIDALVNALSRKAKLTRMDLAGVDVLLYAIPPRAPGWLTKALCIAPLDGTTSREGLAGAVNRLLSPCVECLIIATPAGLDIHDLANARVARVHVTGFTPWQIDCVVRYADTGHVIFLDPLFDDPDFTRQCWLAFSRSMALLEEAGLRGHEVIVRTALQIVVDRCLASLDAHVVLQNAPSLAGADLHGIDGSIIHAINDAWNAIPDFKTRIDERMLGFLMERSMLDQQKRETGSYYTPRAWAWYTCHESLLAFIARPVRDEVASHADEQDLRRISVLDPAMGAGDFLDAMALDLVDAWLHHIVLTGSNTRVDWNAFRMRAKLDHVFKHNLHGIDVSELAVDVARARFFLNVAKHLALDPSLIGLLRGFEMDLVAGDFLTRCTGATMHDIVVGNPPYLMEVRNNQALFRRYSKHPGTSAMYEPKMDLFYFFMFKGVEQLRDDGILGFVVQEYWLDRFHARRLREYMFTRTAIVEFTMFKNCKVFTSAPGQHTMIVVARRTGSPSKMQARIVTVHDTKLAGMQLLGELLVKGGPHARVHHVLNGSMYDTTLDKVFASGDAEQGLFERMHTLDHRAIQASHIQVGINIPQPSIRLGGKMEGVFVIPRAQVPSIAISLAERSIIKPFHKATDINAYQFSPSEEFFIIYTNNEAMKRVETERDAFAGIRAHLDRYARYITSDHRPYGLHRPRQLAWFEAREKIVGVRKTRLPRFAVIPQDYYMDQAALFICLDASIGMSPYYACAFLNSPVAFQVFSGIKTQGGQLQIDKSVLTRVPILACHDTDHGIISSLSAWLHVLGVLQQGRKALPDAALLTCRIRAIIDGFFKRLVHHGCEKPLLDVNDNDSIPNVTISDHLIKRACMAGIDGLESTVVDLDGLFESASRAVSILARVVARLEPGEDC